jgi:hypothetical protein
MLALGTSAHAATVLDFETAGQFTNNFRKLSGPGNGTQTGPSAGNDFVSLPGTTNFTSVYDTTPADATEKTVFSVAQGSPVSFTADVRFSTATSSFGVYFVDPTNEANAYLALLNMDQTSPSELVRLSTVGAIPTTGAAGTLVNGSPSLGDVVQSGQFATATFTYAIDANNHPVLSVTVGSVTSSATFDTITSPLTTVELAVRDSTQNVGQNDFDNVTLPTPVPEPAGLAMLALGAPALARRRRRTVG